MLMAELMTGHLAILATMTVDLIGSSPRAALRRNFRDGRLKPYNSDSDDHREDSAM